MPWNTHKAHPKRKEFPGVTKVTTPGRRNKNSQIAMEYTQGNPRGKNFQV
jgi:hypothetical protein